MKTYLEFVEAVNITVQEIFEERGEAWEVYIQDTVKNNAVREICLVVKKQGDSIAPTLYLDQCYEEYRTEGRSIGDISEHIIECVHQKKPEMEFIKGMASNVRNFQKIQDKVKLKIVNRELNKIQLLNIPHFNFLDLSVICYIQFDVDKTITVKKEMMDMWGVQEEELFKIGYQNTYYKVNYVCQSMKSVIAEMMGMDVPEDVPDMLYIFSNQEKSFGSIAITFTECLQDAQRFLGEKFYIIPSSIHELILVKEEAFVSAEELKDTIVSVNMDGISSNEVLSDHAYYFDGEKVSCI